VKKLEKFTVGHEHRKPLDPAAQVIHRLLDMEERLLVLEKKHRVKTEPFWVRRLRAAVRNKECESHLKFCRRMVAETTVGRRI